MSKEKKILAFSLGGSIVVPEEVNVDYLIKFKKLITKYKNKYKKIIIIVGGGSLARKYQKASKEVNKKLTNADLDWIGIYATHYNAQLVKFIFKDLAYAKVVTNPSIPIKTNKKVIVGGGWKPGVCTDYDMVLIAKIYNLDEVVNLSNVSYVYDKDPKKYKNAKPFINMTWNELKKIVGNKWVPGANVLFDPKAINLAKKLKLKVVSMNGTDLNNFENYLLGKEFNGTTIFN